MKFKLNFLLSTQDLNKAYHVDMIITTLCGYSRLTIIATHKFSKLNLKHLSMTRIVKLFTWRQTKKKVFQGIFLGQGRKSEWDSSFFKKYCYWTTLGFLKKPPLQPEPYGQKTSWLLLFARTLKNKFANKVLLDEAAL